MDVCVCERERERKNENKEHSLKTLLNLFISPFLFDQNTTDAENKRENGRLSYFNNDLLHRCDIFFLLLVQKN